MAKLPPPKDPELEPRDPNAWFIGYRWAGMGSADIQVHECDRALWLAAHWASGISASNLQCLPALDPGRARTVEVVSAREPAAPIEGVAVELLCGTCPQAAPCRGAALVRSCRTCVHVRAEDGWFCGLDGGELDGYAQRQACVSWLSVRPR
jgi:hypothetical protein